MSAYLYLAHHFINRLTNTIVICNPPSSSIIVPSQNHTFSVWLSCHRRRCSCYKRFTVNTYCCLLTTWIGGLWVLYRVCIVRARTLQLYSYRHSGVKGSTTYEKLNPLSISYHFESHQTMRVRFTLPYTAAHVKSAKGKSERSLDEEREELT